MSTSTPPEESASHLHNRDSPDTPVGATHTVLTVLEQATSREGRPDSTASTVIGTTHNILHRLTPPSSSTYHASAHATPSPEALLDAAAAAAAPTVLGAAQNVLSRLTHATPHATPAPQTQKPVPDLPREQLADTSSPMEAPQRHAADSTAQGGSRSVPSRGGGSGEGHAIIPPRGLVRVTRSYPALPDATHPPRSIRASHVHRRPTGTHADSETAWHPFDDRDPVRFSPMMSFLMSWAVDLPGVFFSVPRKKCWSALGPNRHCGKSRAFQGHTER
jgi:hypothetical protein